jgi:pimeloyl-ACP methyl ester carboxylesterase
MWLFMLPLLALGVGGLAVSPLLPTVTLAPLRGYGLILAWLVGDPHRIAGSQPAGQPLRPGASTGSGVVVMLSVMTLLASTPAGLEASDRGQAPIGGVTPSAEATAARYPTLHRTVKIAELEIFYREAGPKGAPTILLLHGFPTSSHMFRALIPALSDQYHVVAPDYPGFGYSSMPSVNQFDYTFDRLADVMDQFVQRLGLTKYSLYVMDYGAPVGFRLAVKHPERIQALIVQNGNAYEEGLRDFWKPFRSYWRARTEANAAALRKFLVLDATKWQYTHGVRNPEAISPDNWLVDQALLDRPGNKEIQLQLFFDYGSNPALYPAWQSYFRTHQPPTLVVWGKNDYIFPMEGALLYTRDLKTIERHLLDTGHFALEEDGALIAQHMRRFLIKHVPPTDK